jgi:hypothetical protein
MTIGSPTILKCQRNEPLMEYELEAINEKLLLLKKPCKKLIYKGLKKNKSG